MSLTKPVFIMLVGLPGSGKSTFRSGYDPDFVNLSTDDYIEQVAKFRGVTYSETFAECINEATQLVKEEFNHALLYKNSIIWDQTNLTEKKRRSILSQIPAEYYKICIVVKTDEETRQKRLTSRVGKTIPKHVDESMLNSFVQPTMDEGWDLIREVTN